MSIASCFFELFCSIAADSGIKALALICDRKTGRKLVASFLVLSFVVFGLNLFQPEDQLTDVSSVRQMQIQQHLLGVKGLAFTVSNSSDGVNTQWLRTQGEFFSAHRSGHTYRSSEDQPIVYFSNTLWAIRDTWELRTYASMLCARPENPVEQDGNSALFPYARITKHFWTSYRTFTVEIYRCDGSLVSLWSVVPRFWFSFFHHWNVRESSSGRVVGRIDALPMHIRSTFNATVASEEDVLLFAHTAILAASTRVGKGDSGSSGNGAGNFRGAGGAAAAR